MLQEPLPGSPRSANLVSLYQSKAPGWGGAWSGRSPTSTLRSLGQPPPSLSHLVDGSFQAAQTDAELQPSQEVVGHSGQDVQLLIHKAVQGGSFCQMAPGRPQRVSENPRC